VLYARLFWVLLQCAVDTLCGITIPLKIQNALSLLTDYCSIIAECKVCAWSTCLQLDAGLTQCRPADVSCELYA
jgi:hypothetical protein